MLRGGRCAATLRPTGRGRIGRAPNCCRIRASSSRPWCASTPPAPAAGGASSRITAGIVVKPAGATRYTRYDKVGWGSPVRTDGWAADAFWFGNAPQLILALNGSEAEQAIPRIRAAVASYPFRKGGDYRAWPGPNSNTFVAHVVSEVPDLGAALPPTALGKDWHPLTEIVSLTPSRTGVQVQLGGYLGLAIGWVEGLEMNLLGLVTGFDLRRPALKLPGWGRIGMPIEATG
jgi:hypothetical protein